MCVCFCVCFCVCVCVCVCVCAGIMLQAMSFNSGFPVVKIIIIIIIIIINHHHHHHHHCIHIGLCALCKCSFLKALRFGELNVFIETSNKLGYARLLQGRGWLLYAS